MFTVTTPTPIIIIVLNRKLEKPDCRHQKIMNAKRRVKLNIKNAYVGVCDVMCV